MCHYLTNFDNVTVAKIEEKSWNVLSRMSMVSEGGYHLSSRGALCKRPSIECHDAGQMSSNFDYWMMIVS